MAESVYKTASSAPPPSLAWIQEDLLQIGLAKHALVRRDQPHSPIRTYLENRKITTTQGGLA
ncbi:hypothetical protein C0992_000523 [Termitomyces sp. T32_za158]|nr:hypothetical protein C0992_000523 [Termitomyces sp. T32_za158]